MTVGVSWWVLALAIGVTAPLWVRALVRRWEAQAQQRTRSVVQRVPPRVDDNP